MFVQTQSLAYFDQGNNNKLAIGSDTDISQIIGQLAQ
jgi:hypothetical protein